MKIAEGPFFCIVQHLFFSALHSLCHAKPEKERVKFHWEFIIQFPWMQSNKMLEICECGIAYAQIGRKLFSCSDDNVAFPRSWVISLRDLKLCDERFFSLCLSLFSLFYLKWVGLCVRGFDIHSELSILRWWCKMERVWQTYSPSDRMEKVQLVKMKPYSPVMSMALH